MRWDQQKLDDDHAALLPLKGMIRTLATPEFDGVSFHEIACRTALNKVPAQSSMPFRWTINTTRGCLHQCVYCFARKTHEYLDLDSGRDFDTQIIVKTNVVEVLRAELAKPSWGREHVALGTNSDPYMRAEGRYRLMPGIIAALAESGTPFSILTKGPLLRRDLPLLKEAAQQVPVSVAVSLAMVDGELQQRVEPGTPDPRARWGLIRAIADASLDCQVLAMPILPWLTDSEEHLDALHAALAQAGARDVTTGALHLRPGAREWFMTWLAAQHPQLVGRYRRLYRGGSYADRDYRRRLGERAAAARRRHGFGDGADPMWRDRSAPEAAPQDLGPQPALF